MNEFEAQLRDALRNEEPPVLERKVWLGIKDQFSRHRKLRIRRRRIIWSAAASVLLLSGFAYLWLNPSNTEELVLEQYGLHQYNYPLQVEQRLVALTGTKIPANQVDQFNALKNQLHFLDKQYLNYIEYIEQNGYQEFIGKQIKNYYEVKIELLEKIQKEIEKLKLKKDENDPIIKEVEWQI